MSSSSINELLDTGLVAHGKRVGIILSGRNVDLDNLPGRSMGTSTKTML